MRSRSGVSYTDRNKSLNPDELFVTLPGGATQCGHPVAISAASRPQLDYLGLGPVLSYDRARSDQRRRAACSRRTTRRTFRPRHSTSTKRSLRPTSRSTSRPIDRRGRTDRQHRRAGDPHRPVVERHCLRRRRSVRRTSWARNIGMCCRASTWLCASRATSSSASVSSRQIQRPRLDDLRVALVLRGGYQCGELPRWSDVLLQRRRRQSASAAVSRQRGRPDVREVFRDQRLSVGSALLQGHRELHLRRHGSSSTSPAFRRRPASCPAPRRSGFFSTKANTKGGHMYGGELAGTLPFAVFTPALEGFGITGGVGYTKTKIDDFNGNRSQIPGYSKWVANGTAVLRAGRLQRPRQRPPSVRLPGRFHRLRRQSGPPRCAEGNHLRCADRVRIPARLVARRPVALSAGPESDRRTVPVDRAGRQSVAGARQPDLRSSFPGRLHLQVRCSAGPPKSLPPPPPPPPPPAPPPAPDLPGRHGDPGNGRLPAAAAAAAAGAGTRARLILTNSRRRPGGGGDRCVRN